MKKLSVKTRQIIFIGITMLLGATTPIIASKHKAPEPVPAKQIATTNSSTDTIKMFDPAPDIDLTSVWQSVNTERENAGLQPLVRDPLLDKSAQEKCDDMVAKDYWSHDAPDGTEPWVFIKKYNVYTTAGENLAYGFLSAKSVVSGWMASEGHRKNILNGLFTNVGYAQCKYPANSKEGSQTLIIQHLTDNPTS